MRRSSPVGGHDVRETEDDRREDDGCRKEPIAAERAKDGRLEGRSRAGVA